MHDPHQTSFKELLDPEYPERCAVARVPSSGIRVIEDSADPACCGKKRSRAILDLRNLLWKFIRRMNPGDEFQAIDFSNWVQETRPHMSDSIDLRSTGGMFRDLSNAGIIERSAYRNNGGNKKSNYHGTPRSVWRIVHIDYSRLGWLEDARASGYEEDLL